MPSMSAVHAVDIESWVAALEDQPDKRQRASRA
jgi:hypothetical protein